MYLATLEQLETHSLTTTVKSLAPKTGTMMIGISVNVLLRRVELGGLVIAIIQTSMVSIVHVVIFLLGEWTGRHGVVTPSDFLK